VEQDRLTTLEYELLRKSTFFRFAVKYVAQHKNLPRDFEVDQRMVEEFKAFLEEEEFQYTSAAEKKLQELEETIQENEYDSDITVTLNQLRAQLEAEKQQDFQRSQDYVERTLKLEMVSKLWGREARYEEAVMVDPQIVAALEILTAPGRYQRELGS
jgi:carboxyl-terminal processing protease